LYTPQPVVNAHPDTIYLTGATGTGKSDVAIELAKLIDGEIVNGDAYQIYRGFDIVAAIPGQAERAEVPHHLYACLDPDESFDAVRYASMAEPVIADIRSRGKHPIVVGGSGLYIKALTHGLAPTPKGDPALRQALDAIELDELCAWLKSIDPEGAASTNLKNRRYVSRNLEIALLAGERASNLKKQWQRDTPNLIGFHLNRDRELLKQRIDARTHTMFAAGLVGEIRALNRLSETAGRAIGIREVRALLAGEISEPEAIAAIQQATRRYAKRQRTWFRREKALQSVCLDDHATAKSVALELVERLQTSS